MQALWIEPADGGRFAVMVRLKAGDVRCYGRYRSIGRAADRLRQLARSAPLAPEPEALPDGGADADSYKHLPGGMRA